MTSSTDDSFLLPVTTTTASCHYSLRRLIHALAVFLSLLFFCFYTDLSLVGLYIPAKCSYIKSNHNITTINTETFYKWKQGKSKKDCYDENFHQEKHNARIEAAKIRLHKFQSQRGVRFLYEQFGL